jgi:selenocysteine lyase/cysteine desulfurase
MSTPPFDLTALRRDEFSGLTADGTIYLNNASTGPLPRRAVEAMAHWNTLRSDPSRISQELQFGLLARGRESIARLVGATPEEIALGVNTSFGINLAAFSLPLRAGDVVLSPAGEFPANVYPWMQLAAQRGVEHRMVRCEGGVLSAEQLARELEDERVRAVTVSWVGFANGARVDLGALGALCHARGVFFVVDAIQGLGPLTLDLRAAHVDILACGAQKWLLSPWGAAFVYVRRALIEQLEPHDVSWLAVQGADDFNKLIDYDLTWRRDARRFEFVTLPFQDYAGMNASLDLFLELGPDAIAAHAQALANRVVEWARSRDGVELVTPADASRHAAIVSVRVSNARAASERLTLAGVAHSLREGAIRLSPHFYNTDDEVDRALDILGKA